VNVERVDCSTCAASPRGCGSAAAAVAAEMFTCGDALFKDPDGIAFMRHWCEM
jgi:hypothetical protein